MPELAARAISVAMQSKLVTVSDLASAVGEPSRTVAEWLTDASTMSLSTLVEIANFLQVLPSSFF